MKSLFNVDKSWTIYKIRSSYVTLYKIIYFFCYMQQGIFGIQSNIYGGTFLQDKLTARSRNYFWKNAPQ